MKEALQQQGVHVLCREDRTRVMARHLKTNLFLAQVHIHFLLHPNNPKTLANKCQ